METVFLISLGLLVYTYLGYFALLCLLSPLVRRCRARRTPATREQTHLPTVSMVISLHNEETLVAQRMENFENLDYPTEKLELVLGDDCSSDRTRAIVRERMGRNGRIRLFEFDARQGKTAVINQLVSQCRGEVIAFTDANTSYAPDALRRMVQHFADPRVGAVCGRLILRSATGINTEDQYWQYETLIKRRENDLGVVLGAHGGIYALRKGLFHPLPSHVVQIDDFIWPLRVYEYGCRAVYEPAAVATEESAPTVEAEFRRKIRIGTGDYRALVECRRLLLPWKGWISFSFWSHKVLRWCAPFFLIVLLVSNAFLLDRPLYRLLFAMQVAFYAGAALGWSMSRRQHAVAKLLRIPYYFVAGNLALLIGCFKCLTGRQQAAWSGKAHRTC